LKDFEFLTGAAVSNVGYSFCYIRKALETLGKLNSVLPLDPDAINILSSLARDISPAELSSLSEKCDWPKASWVIVELMRAV